MNQNQLPRKVLEFILNLEDMRIAEKLSAKYNLEEEQLLNLCRLIIDIVTKKIDLEQKSFDELMDNYSLNVSEEIKTYLKKDIILEVVPLVNKLWEEEKTEEEPYEEREKRYLEMMKTIVEKPLLKEETKEEEIPEAQLEKETKEEIPSIPFTISWKPESEEVVEIKEEKEKEKPSEGSEMIQIEFKKEEEKRDEEAIDLSQI